MPPGWFLTEEADPLGLIRPKTYFLPARIWHWTKASFVGEVVFDFEYQFFPSGERYPPFCNAHVQPSLSRILPHLGSTLCARAALRPNDCRTHTKTNIFILNGPFEMPKASGT
jgi:hypothetical protein